MAQLSDFDLDQFSDATLESLLTTTASPSAVTSAPVATTSSSDDDGGGLDTIGLEDLPDLLAFAESTSQQLMPFEKQLQQPGAQQPVMPQQMESISIPFESSSNSSQLIDPTELPSSDMTNNLFESLISDHSPITEQTEIGLTQVQSTAQAPSADPFFFGGNVIFQEAIPPPPEVIRQQNKRTTSRSSEEDLLSGSEEASSPPSSVPSPPSTKTSKPAKTAKAAKPTPVVTLEEDEESVDDPTPDKDDVSTPERYTLASAADVKPSAEELRRESDPSLCYVCGEKAGKHSYYGGRVCPSCRAFFRRAVQSKYYEIFFCVKGEHCEINIKTRRGCQFCRFKKCLDSGMRIAWVLPDGERNRRFNKLQKTQYRNSLTTEDKTNSKPKARGSLVKDAVAQQQALVKSLAAGNTPLRKTPLPLLKVTREDMNLIQDTVYNLGMSTCKNLFTYLASNADFMTQLASACYFGGKMDFAFQNEFDKMCDFFTHEHFTALEEFKSLPLDDRRQLVESNGRIIKSFKNSLCIHDTESCFCKGIDKATRSRKYPWLEEINEKLTTLDIPDRKPQISYTQLFPSPWAANYEDETRHYELTLKMRNWPRDSPDSPLDDILIILMKLILGFNADFITLQRRDIVEKAQLKYLSMMHKYLVYKYGKKANGRMVEGLMMMAYAREADEIVRRRLPV